MTPPLLRLRGITIGGLVWCLLAALAVSCGGDDKTEEEAAADLCSDLDAFESSLTTLASLDPQSTTIDEFRAAQEKVGDDLDDVSQSAGDVANFNEDELKNAYDDLNGVVGEIDDQNTLADTRAVIQTELNDVATAWENALASVPCELPQR